MPYTGGWSATADGIDTLTAPLTLSAGRHVIRLSRGEGYAEFDSIDLR